MLLHTRLIATSTLFACLIVGRVSLAQFAPATTEVLVQSGSATPSGVGKFSEFGLVNLSSQGIAAFAARLAGGGVSDSNDTGIYRADSVSTVNIAREGQMLPGNIERFGNFNPGSYRTISINNSGIVAFSGRIVESASTGSPLYAVFSGDEMHLVELLREGESLRGLTSSLGYLKQLAIDQNGSVTIRTSDALLAADGARIKILAERWDTAPNGQGQLTRFNSVFSNTTGQTAILAEVTIPPFQQTDIAMLRVDKSGVVMLIREGERVPNSSSRFTFFGRPRINSLGQVTFTASYVPLLSGNSGRGIYLADGMSVTEVVRSGNLIPDGSAVFSSFNGSGTLVNPVIGDGGDVAFVAFLGGDQVDLSNDSGIYRGNGETLVEVARAGQPVPNGPGEFFGFASEHKAVNQQGQVLFSNLLSGNGVDLANNFGIYLHDDSLGLMTVARTGDKLLGSTITELAIGDYESGLSTSFNNLGQVAYNFRLANGVSGIALYTSPQLIPEPTTALIALLSCAGFIMSTRRARRGR